MEKMYMPRTAMQYEELMSPILWNILYVVKTGPDFKNLAYRVTTDMSGKELLIIYRNQVARVFGPPLEPISLTLDPNGKCMVYIPFRPMQQVPVTKAKSGQLDLPSLHTLLHMVTGKGFCFCPGIPEKFLAGRACGKFAVLHRVPFKRFNAAGCPVYFQIPKTKDLDESQIPIRTLCPRCRKVAKWAQTLPVTQKPHPSAQNTGTIPPHPNQASYDVLANVKTKIQPVVQNQPSVIVPNPTKEQPASPADIHQPASEVTPSTLGIRLRGDQVISTTLSAKKITPGAGGLMTGAQALSKKRGMNNEKLQAVSESLRLLLKQRTMSKDGHADVAVSPRTDGGAQARDDKSPGSHSPRSSRGEKTRKNICRYCSKQFSSNLRLSKHVQRHEGNTRYLSQVMQQKMPRQQSSAVLLSRLFRGSRIKSASSPNGSRRCGVIPKSSLQLMLKSLDELLGKKEMLKGKKIPTKVQPNKPMAGKRKRKVQSPQPKLDIGTTRPSLHRTGSGLEAVQTLLNAAEMAEEDSSRDSSARNTPHFQMLTSLSNSYPAISSNKDHEFSNGRESPSQSQSARQSVRLATKRANKKMKSAPSTPPAAVSPAAMDVDNPAEGRASNEAMLMTNLDLLSTVSIEAELRDSQASPNLQLNSYAGNPDSKINKTVRNSTKPLISNSIPSFIPSAPLLLQSQSSGMNVIPQGSVILDQIPATVLAEQNKCIKKNQQSSVTQIIPGKVIIFNPPPHSSSSTSQSQIQVSSTSKTVTVPISQLLSSSVLQNLAASTGVIPTLEGLGPSCGAMDLSKPKMSPVEISSSDKTSSTSQDSSDALRHFMMINPLVAPQKAAVPTSPLPTQPTGYVNTKEADESLQARIYASAKSYKVDSGKQSKGQVHAVIASSSPTAFESVKQGKGKEKPVSSANEKSEIHCGYKWSGSGGLVKERTQLVREIVPPVVISKIMNPGLPKVDSSVSTPGQNITKLRGSQKQQQQQSSHNLSKSPTPASTIGQAYKSPQRPSANGKQAMETSANSSTIPLYVLNLSKGQKEQEAAAPLAFSSPAKRPATSSILKTSLLNTAAAASLPSTNSVTANVIRNKLLARTSVLVSPANSSLLTSSPHILATSQPASNSNLAAILQNSSKSSSVSSPSSIKTSVSISLTLASPVLTNVGANNFEITEIKTEPPEIVDNVIKVDDIPTVISPCVDAEIKTETEDLITETPPTAERELSTPPNLVVDMGSERIMALPSNGGKSTTKKSNKTQNKGKVSTVKGSLKCEFCSQPFHSSGDHISHICKKKLKQR